jgi:hypothetical protein
MKNNSMRIYDKHRMLVPVGVAGEIYVGGGGVTRGYFNRPQLTDEKFITIDGHRYYRTGDLARYLPDGCIEFLGRIDNQVKVRGFRIELGEVEAILRQHSSVRESLVVALDDAFGERRLVAYVVKEQAPENAADELQVEDSSPPQQRNGTAALIKSLKDHLSRSLPDYMLPSFIVVLDSFPLTVNGKVDRCALPPPQSIYLESGKNFEAPRTATEEVLASLWSKLLGISHFGIHDDFFELGGHSLLATRVVSQVREIFQVQIFVRQFFEQPTIASLAEIIEKSEIDAAEIQRGKIVPLPRDAYRR